MRGAVRCVRERREPQGAQQLRGRRTAGRTTRKGKAAFRHAPWLALLGFCSATRRS